MNLVDYLMQHGILKTADAELMAKELQEDCSRTRDIWVKRAADTAEEMNRLLDALGRIAGCGGNDLSMRDIATDEIKAHWERQRKDK